MPFDGNSRVCIEKGDPTGQGPGEKMFIYIKDKNVCHYGKDSEDAKSRNFCYLSRKTRVDWIESIHMRTQHHPIITIFKKYTNDSGTCQLDNHRKCPFLSVPPENHSIIGY